MVLTSKAAASANREPPFFTKATNLEGVHTVATLRRDVRAIGVGGSFFFCTLPPNRSDRHSDRLGVVEKKRGGGFKCRLPGRAIDWQAVVIFS